MPAKMLVSLEYRKFRAIWQGLNIYQNCSKFVNLSALSRTKRGQISPRLEVRRRESNPQPISKEILILCGFRQFINQKKCVRKLSMELIYGGLHQHSGSPHRETTERHVHLLQDASGQISKAGEDREMIVGKGNV
jgi:hypothetical protein